MSLSGWPSRTVSRGTTVRFPRDPRRHQLSDPDPLDRGRPWASRRRVRRQQVEGTSTRHVRGRDTRQWPRDPMRSRPHQTAGPGVADHGLIGVRVASARHPGSLRMADDGRGLLATLRSGALFHVEHRGGVMVSTRGCVRDVVERRFRPLVWTPRRSRTPFVQAVAGGHATSKPLVRTGRQDVRLAGDPRRATPARHHRRRPRVTTLNVDHARTYRGAVLPTAIVTWLRKSASKRPGAHAVLRGVSPPEPSR